MSEAKPFCISKKEVWEAYKRVKANKGAAGVDEQSIEDFDKKLKKNLYKIWNRMSSGSDEACSGAMDRSLYRALAESTSARRGRAVGSAGEGHSPRGRG